MPDRLVSLAVDEPLLPEQWSLSNHGQERGSPGADIGAIEAWELTTGHPSVVVAIIDSGVDFEHVDLTSAAWLNESEVPSNGLDDDGNGFVDDVGGWDFVDSDAQPRDELGHGSAVAAIVGARLNRRGMAGVAPDATLMAVRACAAACSMSALIAAVEYSVRNGANIINLSLGGRGEFFEPLSDALDMAEDSGILVVAAAGNLGADNDEHPFFPASFPNGNIIAVAASDRWDAISEFSNIGRRSVDLAAPGEDVLTVAGDSWGSLSGTSFASAHVTGVAALMKALAPDLTAERVRESLLDHAETLSQMDGWLVTGGRLDAGAAVFSVSGPVARGVVTPDAQTAPSGVGLEGSASYDRTASSLSFEWRMDGRWLASGPRARAWIPDAAAHSLELIVVDEDGLTDSAVFVVDLNGVPDLSASASSLVGFVPLQVEVEASVEDVDDDAADVWWLLNGSPRRTVGGKIVVTEPGAYQLTAVADDGTDTAVLQIGDVLAGKPFVDAEDSTHRDAIAWASATGVTNGCSEDAFCPGRPASRAQAAAFLARFLDLEPGPDAFTDDSDMFFEDDINALANAGISTGCRMQPIAEFCPTDLLTRGQFAAFLVRALDISPVSGGRFVDLAGSPFSVEAESIAAAGLTVGCNPPLNDRFCPKDPITRAQVVAMLYRATAD